MGDTILNQKDKKPSNL